MSYRANFPEDLLEDAHLIDFLKMRCGKPASAYVEMLLAAAREVFKEEFVQLDDLFIHHALVLPPDSSRLLQLILTPSAGEANAEIQIFSCPENEDGDEDRWTLHASGNVRVGRSQNPGARTIPANLVFDHPTVGALTAYLVSMMPGPKVLAMAER